MRLGIGPAVLFGLALILPPVILDLAQGSEPPSADRALAPVRPGTPPQPASAFQRSLFGQADTDIGVEDQPVLVGIFGRIGRDAVAIVRSSGGETRTLGLGDSVEGWRLEALSADAASFRRGNRQVRVAVPGQ